MHVSKFLLRLFATASFSVAASLTAQSAQPITSLPKAPNDPTRNLPAAASAPVAAAPVDVPASPATPAASGPAYGSAANPVVATPVAPPPATVPAPVADSSSAPPPVQRVYTTPQTASGQTVNELPKDSHKTMRPFSTVGIGFTVGIDGFGAELAIPLATPLNLRASAAFFSYNGDFTENGQHITGDVKLRTARVNIDYYPFHGSFRISPGITLYNGNNVNATTSVPGGSTFSLGDQDYYSSPNDPVHGTASLTFGNRTAPNITMGFGNMIPRSRKHFSVPFEIGFEYIDQPLLTFNLAGTACSNGANSGCANIATDPQSQANLKQEEIDLNNDLSPLRFFPIVSIGLSYKF